MSWDKPAKRAPWRGRGRRIPRGITIPVPMNDWLRRHARRHGISVNEAMVRLLEEGMKRLGEDIRE